ncbi:adaptor protein MecA [Macrococcus carouselicus]|uniref:Adapter protein MecA n=1 Tax=Macrococcus carouselicus TaxID=69969 RepID=A0A9Q8CLX4_9STAP|nr:adaptor protein MecA [Macrococcus carouselicus]TDM03797.1 adaptor protein MecA [Macrococcus carouselicus]
MRIERVNDSTIKFYLTYRDIEERGFRQDDLWMNRRKGEEFFWSMMEEINEEEEFVVEGPLWIQVHAFDKGIEFVVTKSKSDDFMHLPEEETSDQLEYQVNEYLNKALEHDQGVSELLGRATEENKQKTRHDLIGAFRGLEEVIQYSHAPSIEIDMEDLLYMHDGKYYYYVHFDERAPEEEMDSFVAQLFEYADPTKMNQMMLEEYGKVVLSHNVRRQVRKYFAQ